MRGLLGSIFRSRIVASVVLVALACAQARAGDLRAPVTFDFSGSLALEPDPSRAAAPLKLAQPVLPGTGAAGVDALLERVAPGRSLETGERIRIEPGLRPGPSLAPLARSRPPPSGSAVSPLVVSPPLRLTTRLAHTVRTLGEFRTRDWNALGAVTPLAVPDVGTGGIRGERSSDTPSGAMQLPGVDVLRLSAPPELPRAKASVPAVDLSDTGPAAMAEAEQAVAEARARGARRARARAHGGEPLMVLPDFGTSSFQVGASFSLAGRSGGRIAFGEKPAGPFEQGLSSRQGFGLMAPGAGESLRLGNPDEPAPAPKPAKEDADKRLWTGVVFNF